MVIIPAATGIPSSMEVTVVVADIPSRHIDVTAVFKTRT